MNDPLESLCNSLARQGWYVVLSRGAGSWTCELNCSADILPANIPRPRVVGSTAYEAVQLAMEARPKPKAA